jgi:hypothetical protein
MRGVWRPFGFGLLRSVPEVVPTQPTLDYLEEIICPHFIHGPPPVNLGHFFSWLERSPDWRNCVWWWGDKKGVEEYKRWGDKLYGVLSEYPELIPIVSVAEPDSSAEPEETSLLRATPYVFSTPVEKPRLGYHGSLAALCSFAAQAPALARIEDRVVVDGLAVGPGADVEHTGLPSLPPCGTFWKGLKYVFTEIDADGIMLAKRVLDRLLGRSRHDFHVNRKQMTVRLDDVTFSITDDMVLLVLEFYEEAAGNPRTFAWMQAQDPLLHGVRIDRVVIPKIPEPIRNLIKSVRGQGSWLDLSQR